MSCENCLNRRRFLAMAAGGAAVALVGCGDGELSGVSHADNYGNPFNPGNPGGPSNKVIKVGDYPALAIDSQLVNLIGTNIAVKRTGTTTFTAFNMRCTHEGCQTDIISNKFECFCHGSKFDNDGNVTMGPAAVELARFTTSYDVATDLLTIS